MDIQIHKAQKKKKKKTPDSLNLNTATLRPFKIKSSEVKDNFKSGPHKTMGRFLNRNFSDRENEDDILKILKEDHLSQEFNT